MEAKLMERKVTKEQAYLSELALASFNKKREVYAFSYLQFAV
jgi:hypothetical protein